MPTNKSSKTARTPEAWEYRAALRALLEVGWNCLTDGERAVIDRWEGR